MSNNSEFLSKDISTIALLQINCLFLFVFFLLKGLGPVVQSVVSLMSLLRVISLTVLADSIYNILIFFQQKFQLFAYHSIKILTNR